jgi:hypothetical protein
LAKLTDVSVSIQYACAGAFVQSSDQKFADWGGLPPPNHHSNRFDRQGSMRYDLMNWKAQGPGENARSAISIRPLSAIAK